MNINRFSSRVNFRSPQKTSVVLGENKLERSWIYNKVEQFSLHVLFETVWFPWSVWSWGGQTIRGLLSPEACLARGQPLVRVHGDPPFQEIIRCRICRVLQSCAQCSRTKQVWLTDRCDLLPARPTFNAPTFSERSVVGQSGRHRATWLIIRTSNKILLIVEIQKDCSLPFLFIYTIFIQNRTC